MIGRNRVVVTGIGILAANGIGKNAFWNSLLAGESGIGPITQFDASEIPWQIAGEINGFTPEDYIDRALKPKRQSRNTQLAAAATVMALQDAGLDSTTIHSSSPVPIYLGISLGGMDLLEQHTRRIIEKGMLKAQPSASGCVHIFAPSFVSAMLQCPTKINVISNSCTGGLDAIAYGAALIKKGEADIVIAGGTDAVIIPSVISGLGSAGMLGQHTGTPETASRPFDLKRSGGIAAEGAGVLILESYEHAAERGAAQYAEILGHGAASSVNSSVSDGLASSMMQAIDNSGCCASDISMINAHAPSDELLDLAETRAIKTVFGNRGLTTPVTSIKGAIGNPLAAGGSIQAIASCMSHREAKVPPIANYEVPDPDCDLDFVSGSPLHLKFDLSIINSHGTGGVNSSLVVKSAEK